MDHRESYQRAHLALRPIVAGITDAHLDLPTPCSEWTVRQLLRHLVGAGYDEAEVMAGHAHRDVPVDCSGSELRQRFEESSRLAVATIADEAVLTRRYPFADHDIPGWLRVSFNFLDALTHSWDLTRATQEAMEWDAALVADGFEVAGLITNAQRGPGKPFGPAVPVPSHAPAADRLLGLLGRDPAWTPATAASMTQ
jgi:uncharacterized protein (TIGR03086 family)